MRKILVSLVVILLLVVGANIPGVEATLFLTGDSNISGFVFNSSVDNSQFFKNVLHGGSNVAVLQGSIIFQDTGINNFYNSVPGVTSSLISGPVTATQLAGVNLLVSGVPSTAFTVAETTLFNSFLGGGGSIFFLGENTQYYSTQNEFINNALAALGSGMSLIPPDFDPPPLDLPPPVLATGSQIAINPFTAGVNSLMYASSSTVSGGTPLFFGSSQSGGHPFVAYEWAVTPIPTSVLLLGSGLLSLVGFRRKFGKQV